MGLEIEIKIDAAMVRDKQTRIKQPKESSVEKAPKFGSREKNKISQAAMKKCQRQ